jgi:hypothetical protein
MPSFDESKQADLRAAYQTLAQMIVYEGQLAWRSTAVFLPFGTLLLAGSISPTIINTDNPQLVAAIATVISILGIAASSMWWSMVSRSRRYYQYWLFSARELEKHLNETIQTFQRGNRLARGSMVDVDGHEIIFQTLERIRMLTNFNLFYGSFLLAFVILLAINMIRVVRAF